MSPISATELPDDIKSAICTVKVSMKTTKHEFIVKDDLNIVID